MGHILIYSPEAIHKTAFDLTLEVAETRLNAGDTVTLLACDAEMCSCYSNPHHRKNICFLCRSAFKDGYRALGRDRTGVQVDRFYNLTPAQQRQVDELRTTPPATLAALKDFCIDGADIGLAAYSSVVDALCEAEPDMKVHRTLVVNNLVTAAMIYLSFCNRFAREKPDELYLFNGRIVSTRPAMRAAQRWGVKFKVYDYLETNTHYALIDSNYPHSLEALKRYLSDKFEQSPLSFDEKNTIARRWFDNRRNNNMRAGIDYTRTQTRGLLPESIDGKAYKVAIYPSSEDEFAAIHEWKNPHYGTQAEGLLALFEMFRSDQSVAFFVRVHPRLANLNNSQTQFFESLAGRFPNVTIISPSSPVNSYTLMDNCDAIVTYGSTAGIEAIYAGKVSFLMGRSIYEDWGAIVRPRTHMEFVGFLKQAIRGDLVVNQLARREAIARYGFVLTYGGEAIRYLRDESTYQGKVLVFDRGGRKKLVGPSPWAVMLARPIYFVKLYIIRRILPIRVRKWLGKN